MNQTEILKYLEEQKTTRTITDLIVHCTATKPGAKVNVDVIDGWHKERGFKKQPQSGRICGYHFVVLPSIWSTHGLLSGFGMKAAATNLCNRNVLRIPLHKATVLYLFPEPHIFKTNCFLIDFTRP